jgi:hypothetical protein
MDQVDADGWVLDDGNLKEQICFHGGDEANFTAPRWRSILIATACQ